MIRFVAGLSAAAASVVTPAEKPPASIPAVRLPGFAAFLADQPLATGPAAWQQLDEAHAWTAIVRSTPETRQAARWSYVGGLIERGRGADALGVLEVMAADDPDLTLVAAWQRARGVALVQLDRPRDALAAFAQPMLARDAETCLWRMRALAEAPETARAALGQLACAGPALDARKGRVRAPFVLFAAGAALATGHADVTLRWLGGIGDADPAANLLRARANMALGKLQDARLRFARVVASGVPEQRADATLGTIELGLAGRTLGASEARRRLSALDRQWRGGTIERRTLTLAMTLADRAHDEPGVLASGAILFRYFDMGAGTAPLVVRLQGILAAAVAPDGKTPIAEAAGLFWDYRDLAPSGPDGVRLVEGLTARLQAAGLYTRAADLLQYRLDAATADVERGPLSVRIASLRILAGDPAAAIRLLRTTDDYPYSDAMLGERRRVEAAALDLVGQTAEALAALDDMPDATAERAEIYWRARDWAHLVSIGEPTLPAPGKLNEVAQTIVLRHAIGLAMLGREDALGRLRMRYAAAFASLPTAPTFTMLTADPAAIDSAALARAMVALPNASPAGAFGDLLDGGSEARAMASKPAA